MTSRRGLEWRGRAATLAICLGALSACGASDGNGTSASGGAANASSGGTMNSGGASSGGGKTASGGTATGNSTGGRGAGGIGTSLGGTGASSTAGAPAADAGSDGATGDDASSSGSPTCTNPAHVLPMNPQNPQDGITLGGFYVATDTWNAANYDVSQTMYVCDYDDWYVVARMNDDAHDGAVKTYPNVHKDFNGGPAIHSFSTISSTFGHAGPHVGVYEFAYDIWLNGVASSGSTEIMIWTDNQKQVPSGSVQDTVTFDGESYKVYKSGSYIAFVDTKNVTSGTVDLLAFFDYVIGKSWIPATSTLGAIDYGVEIVSTDGKDATFTVNAFSLTTK